MLLFFNIWFSNAKFQRASFTKAKANERTLNKCLKKEMVFPYSNVPGGDCLGNNRDNFFDVWSASLYHFPFFSSMKERNEDDNEGFEILVWTIHLFNILGILLRQKVVVLVKN